MDLPRIVAGVAFFAFVSLWMKETNPRRRLYASGEGEARGYIALVWGMGLLLAGVGGIVIGWLAAPFAGDPPPPASPEPTFHVFFHGVRSGIAGALLCAVACSLWYRTLPDRARRKALRARERPRPGPDGPPGGEAGSSR